MGIFSALVVERSDTSVVTLRLIRPPLSTTGMKLRATPKFLNWMEGWQVDGPATPGVLVGALQEKPLRTGNWPPAKKVAFSPEMAVRVGSASV